MRADRRLVAEARRLGFLPYRQARHGDLWRHPSTGRIVSLMREANTYDRSLLNQLAILRRSVA